MSYRPSYSRGGYRGKTQKTYIPKTHNSPSATLSSSLRQPPKAQGSNDSATATSTSTSTNTTSRLRLGENGEWVSTAGNFVNYLPQDEAVAVGLGADQGGGFDPVESQRVVDLLNRELARLLKLKPRDFWRQVAGDTSLHEFLDSFLQFRSRWYDFPYHGAKGIVAGVIVGDLELSRRVFMVLYRISSHRDPRVGAAESLSKKDHEVLLQEKKLLDLPKLLDVCAVFGHENEDLTRELVLNAITAQPEIPGSFTSMMSHLLSIVLTMFQRCKSSLEALISGSVYEDHGSSRQHVEYLEVMDFLNDAVVSMDAFVKAYRPAAVFFSCPVDASHGNEDLMYILATLHDSLLPSLKQGLRIILADGRDDSSILSDVFVSLKILSVRIVDLGWKLLDICYLTDELFKHDRSFPATMKMFPASVEDPVIRADILIQTFKAIAAVPQHAQGKSYRDTYLQNIEKHHQMMQKIQNLQQGGWLLIDDEQYQYLTGILTHPMRTVAKQLPNATSSVRSDGLHMEDVVIVESKISQVKDLFPDYGKGFISACLEVYDHSPEEVIQRILEGTLHEDLQSLDTSMETLPSKSTPPLVKKDKGKGILVEPTGLPTKVTNSVPEKPTFEAISSSSSSTGRFTRKAKVDLTKDDAFGSRDEKDVEKTAALLSQYEYEDEYDDSFDDLGMTIIESGAEETEILRERVRSQMSISSRAESQSSAPGAAKWNSKKKPQFYVKDGKNYSYKVEGSIAVSDQQQASLVTQAQKEAIHGLGRGGNRPLGAIKALEEQNEVEGDVSGPSEVVDGSNAGRGRGRGRGRRGGVSNHYRKDRAMKKHMAGLGGL